jgi:transcriptional regulator with XRE-family HTH domain
MTNDNNKRLGKQICKLRKHNGLTQEELAKKVGVSTKHIQYIEGATRVPSLNVLYGIAHALKVQVSELFRF